jgi:exodeoxyribonuclease VII large subunit
MIGDWIGKLGRVWVEGQITELSRRPGSATVFLVLRDPVANVSLRMTCSRAVADSVVPPLAEGARVVVDAKPELFLTRGSLSLTAFEIRPVGLGNLLARIEALKAELAAEGLFDAARKRPLPFLPGLVGLVTGRASAAERDVVETARRRWPAVAFRVIEVAVQGPMAATQVGEAITALDRDPDVDVIVVARGGGSLEDLLPFSEEALLRIVAEARTPVVSAIGHEPDTPLLDLVADLRAATPTDAARRIVPDVGEEQDRLAHLRARATRVLATRIEHASQTLTALRNRPSLADPGYALDVRREQVAALRARADRCAQQVVATLAGDLDGARGQVRALSPQATLDRGYAVVQRTGDGGVVRDPADAAEGTPVRLRVAGGELAALVTSARP